MTTAVSFHDVSKSYRGAHAYRALRDDLASAAGSLIGFRRRERETVRALDDISFEIRSGTATAIIGPNGAGKTTALKLITRITWPTSGVVRVRGRVGALLEVGTGMHPELSGRENIYLYGRVLGLTRRDIARRFDQIVEFAGVGKAIDQPVKQFSSGMQLRLGFSIAAHVEPDVLLVDEALEVGDAGFQYRCVERMGELIREGRTLVLVSHNMSAVETLCEHAVHLVSGRIVHEGSARDVVRQYLQSVHAARLAADTSAGGVVPGEYVDLVRVSLHNADGLETTEFSTGEPLTVRLHYRTHQPIAKPMITIGLTDGRFGGPFAVASMLIDGAVPEEIDGEGYVECTFTNLPLQPRAYEIWGEVIGQSGFGSLVSWQILRAFEVVGDVIGSGKSAVTHSLLYAPVRIPYRWDIRSSALAGEQKRTASE